MPDFTVVLSSPGDVVEERRLVKDVVTELDGWYAAPLGFTLKLRRWEDKAPCIAGLPVQSAIDEYLNIPNADLVVAVFQGTLGTRSEDGRTGTEHEIGIALEAWAARGHLTPQILVYFDRQPEVSQTVKDTEALLRLLEYKELLKADGHILLGEYRRRSGDFEKRWRRALAEHILARSEHRPLAPPGSTTDLKRWFLVVDKPARFFSRERRASVMRDLGIMANDSTLALEGVSDGLVSLVLEGAEGGFRSIQDRFMQGRLSQIGPPDDSVGIRDVRELDLAFHGMTLPLEAADTHLLQVLINEFRIEANGGGVELSLRFDGTTPAIWSRGAKAELTKAIMANPGLTGRLPEYRKKFDGALLHSGAGCRYFDPDIPFRYANGGVLPVLRRGNEKFYCLFYREVGPVGWNIANGGSDGEDELKDPTKIIGRELREELLMVDLAARQRFWIPGHRPAPPPPDMPDWIRALTLWSDLLAQYGRADVDLPDFEMKPGNITWLDGPDCITVKASDGAARTFPGIFVTVTTEDQAIEIDQIAEIDFPEGCTLLDGEVHSGHLLNRPVGLFNVKRFYEEPKPDTEILPDMMFHTAREVCLDDPPAEPLRPPGPEFAKIYLSRLQLGNSEWGLKENRFGLCPVTASVIRRHRRHLKSA